MHIQANNSLQLAALGAGREEVEELQARRAAEVRRKLSTATHVLDAPEGFAAVTRRVAARPYESETQPGEEDGFKRLFSAKA